MRTDLRFDDETSLRLETLYTSPKVAARRQRAHQVLALHRGEHALEIGFGPGFSVTEMADAVGRRGHIDGIDTSASMLALAQARCARQPWVTLRLGDAARLPYEDETFGAVLVSQVYSYVRDLTKALSELHRVLRPGGRALIADLDWGTLIWQSKNPALMQRIIRAWESQHVHPYLPRTLAPLLLNSGFHLENLDCIVMLSSEIDPYSAGVTKVVSEAVPGVDGITPAEIEAWETDLQQMDSSNSYFFSLNQYLFLVRKPSSAGKQKGHP